MAVGHGVGEPRGAAGRRPRPGARGGAAPQTAAPPRVRAGPGPGAGAGAGAGGRRGAVGGLLLGAASVAVVRPLPAGAGEEGAAAAAAAALAPFEEPATGFRLSVPEGWALGEAAFPGTPPGALWSWVSPEDADCTVTVVVKPISVEFTKMGSFGDVDTWADNIIAAMDNSWQYERAKRRAEAGGGRWEEPAEYSEARLLKAGAGPGGSYAAEYTVRAGGDSPGRRKSVTVVSGLSLRPHPAGTLTPRAPDGRQLPEGNLLFTATGSCPKARSAALLPLLRQSVGSLRLPPPRQ